jgi:hypothetical protein
MSIGPLVSNANSQSHRKRRRNAKESALRRHAIMLCRQITPEGEDMDYTCLALDSVNAGEGDVVVIARKAGPHRPLRPAVQVRRSTRRSLAWSITLIFCQTARGKKMKSRMLFLSLVLLLLAFACQAQENPLLWLLNARRCERADEKDFDNFLRRDITPMLLTRAIRTLP